MSRLRLFGLVLAYLAGGWTLVNAGYVYLLGHVDRSYRLESAAWILVFVLLCLVQRHVPRLVGWPLSDTVLIGAISVIVIVWAAVMLPLARQPFLSDDYVFLEWAHRSGDVLHGATYFRPLFSLVFLGLYRLSTSPLPFHLLGFGLHLASALIVYRLATRFFGDRNAALLVFTLVLLNPIQLEAVAWISGLQELLWSALALAALWLYTRSPITGSPMRMAAAAGLGLLAMLAKETGICVVLLFGIADVLIGRWRRPPIVAFYAVLSAAILGYLALRSHFREFDEHYWFWPSRYFVKQFLARPYEVFSQPWNPTAVEVPGIVRWLVAGALTALLVTAVAVRRTGWRVLVGPAIIVASTLPLYAYFFVETDLISSRYIYFAAIGWAFLVAELMGRLTERTSLYLATIAGIAVLSAISLQVNTRPWKASGELVAAMASEVEHGGDVNDALHTWQRTHPGDLRMKNGLPYQYDGVGIFINGYKEFREFTLGWKTDESAPLR
jgi:hypothetical protein